ncbi:MAG: SUMF1/EgtB/PvdO family nonheme iron enzyme, partial [Chloroflexota bacterium]|nr:SUMF1/EgtB/PvdO family nonheme iron enzyme [Chloroflexota bacterium]
MKRLRLIFALMLLTFALLGVQNNVVVVVLPTVTLEVGQTVEVIARIACPGGGCNGFDMALSWNPAVVRVDAIRAGAYLGAARVPEALYRIDPTGRARFVALVPQTGFVPPPGEDRLFVVELTGVGAGESALIIDAIEVTAAGSSAVGLPGRAIVSAPPTPTDTPAATATLADTPTNTPPPITDTPTPSPSPTPTATPTSSDTPTPSLTPTPDFRLTADGLATGTQQRINDLTQIALSFTPTPNLAQTAAVEQEATAFARQQGQAGYSAARYVQRAGDWSGRSEEFDDVVMVLVPAGCFTMGSDTADAGIRPAHQVCFDAPFWLDRVEVSNQQFARLGGQAALESTWTRAQRPRENLTWYEARDYCARRGGRLPTEAEWEYAARGPDNPLYPWGDLVVNNNMTFIANSGGQTTDVGSRTTGRSWIGALDMSGNVWEWTNTLSARNFVYPYRAYDGREASDIDGTRVIRGGSLNSYETGGVQPYNRTAADAAGYAYDIGVRCARNFAPPNNPLIVPPALQFQPLGMGAANPVTTNRAWSPAIQSIDGVEMALVPTGCMIMGSDQSFDERPLNQQCFAVPFWIDRYEVSNDQWTQFGGVSPRASTWTGGQRPRERITWVEARAYCALRNARLPTEAEWEYAARGPDSLIFPWGNTFNGDLTIHGGGGASQTANVGSVSGGVSWIGAFDMSGNVWEWTSTIYSASRFPYPYRAGDGRESANDTASERVARGGSFAYVNNFHRTAYRFHSAPGIYFDNFGVRCVRDFDAGRFGALLTPEPTPQPTITPTIVPDTNQLGLSAAAPITFNAAWTPAIQAFEGVEMALVPAGCFERGSLDGDTDESARGRLCFESPFWIDRTEVTNAQFATFAGAAAYLSGNAGAQNPRENLTWFEARDFCAARGLRLPSEIEWEYAARGPDNLTYPWGNTFDPSRAVIANWQNNRQDATSAVASVRTGASWVGAQDMGGNVWEWTSSVYDFEHLPSPYRVRGNAAPGTTALRVLRGGAWDSIAYDARTSERNWDSPYAFNPRYGFRCVGSFIGQADSDTTPAFGLSAAAAIRRNDDWTPVRHTFNGIEMMLVPTGCFTMGSRNGDTDEVPTG